MEHRWDRVEGPDVGGDQGRQEVRPLHTDVEQTHLEADRNRQRRNE